MPAHNSFHLRHHGLMGLFTNTDLLAQYPGKLLLFKLWTISKRSAHFLRVLSIPTYCPIQAAFTMILLRRMSFISTKPLDIVVGELAIELFGGVVGEQLGEWLR